MTILKSGIPTIDYDFSGIPKGKITVISGDKEASGKTSLALEFSREATLNKQNVLYFSLEDNLTPKILKSRKVDSNYFCSAKPSSLEELLSITHEVIKEDVGLVVIDSIAALSPSQELDNGEEYRYKYFRPFLREFQYLLTENSIPCLITTHTCNMGGKYITGKEYLADYTAKKFHLTSNGVIHNYSIPIGNVITVKTSRVSSDIDFYYESGFDSYTDLIKLLVRLDELQVKGSWYYWGDIQMGQGLKEAKRYLLNNNDIFKHLYNLKEKLC